MAFLKANINSQYLGGNTHINFILPDKAWGQDAAEFYSSGARYKVLWLLMFALRNAISFLLPHICGPGASGMPKKSSACWIVRSQNLHSWA